MSRSDSLISRRSLATALSVLFVLSPAVANATSGFPNEVRAHLALPRAPECGLCHTTGNAGGEGTVNTPFGKSMTAAGLQAFDTSSLDAALDALAATMTDSDGDGTPDIAELRAGTDPNVANAGAIGADGGTGSRATSAAAPVAPPQYGCAAGYARPVSPANSFVGAAWLIMVLGLTCVFRRVKGKFS